MSTMDPVEQAMKDLNRASEAVGHALARANRAFGSPEHAVLVAKAREASVERGRLMNALRDTIRHHAASQYEMGLEMGRQSMTGKG